MSTLTLIIALSTVMWYIIDRFKPLWSEAKNGKYVTIIISAIFGFGLTFGFNLDLLAALQLVSAASIAGEIITGFILMSGSSAVAEIIAKIKGGSSSSSSSDDAEG